MPSAICDSSPEGVVRRFIQAWSGPDLDRICAMLADDVHYHNIPLEPLSGKQLVEQYLRNAGPFDACEWELVHIAVAGENVLTERVDRMVVGGRAIDLPIMGVFRVVDGLIREWRDYFDLAYYQAQQG